MPEENNPEWCRTNGHFKDSYKNAQEAIRFIDTKTGVMTGLLMVATAAPFSIFKWSASLEPKYQFSYNTFCLGNPVSSQIIIGGMVLGMFLGVLGVIWAVEGLMSRSPRKFYHGIDGTIKKYWDKMTGKHKKKNDRPPITVLFPYFDPKDEVVAKASFHKAVKGLSEKEIGAEYEVQIIQVGRILSRKIYANKISVVLFQFQLMTYGLTGLTAFFIIQLFKV